MPLTYFKCVDTLLAYCNKSIPANQKNRPFGLCNNLPFFRRAYKKRVFIGLALVGCRAKALISFAPDCNVKSIAPRRTVINNLILTTMTHISKKIGNFAL